jgi:hypothetical protein
LLNRVASPSSPFVQETEVPTETVIVSLGDRPERLIVKLVDAAGGEVVVVVGGVVEVVVGGVVELPGAAWQPAWVHWATV